MPSDLINGRRAETVGDAAIGEAYRFTDGAPEHGTTRYSDFTKVNELLEAVEDQIRPEFSTGIVKLIDVVSGEAA